MVELVKGRVPPITPVPDATMKQFLLAARDCLKAAWGVADARNPTAVPPGVPVPPNPKHSAVEAMQALDTALKSAICADGADAVIGYAMVASSLSAKALSMRSQGLGLEPPPDWTRLMEAPDES